MSRKLTVLPIILAFLVAGSLLTAQKKELQTGESVKMEKFLKDLEAAQSLEDLSEAFKSAKFSQAEYEKLAEELKKSKYAQKIELLKSRAEANKKTIRLKYQGKSALQVLDEKKRALEQNQNRKITQVNKQTESRIKIIKTKEISQTRTQLQKPALKLTRTTITQSEITAATRLPGGGTPASITDVDPRRVMVGDELMIRGAGFGNRRGRVVIIEEEYMYECTVSQWSNSLIRVSVPEEIQPDIRSMNVADSARNDVWFGGSRGADRFGPPGVRVLLWVKLVGGETGPTKEIDVVPDLSAYTPEITSIFPSEVSPGMIVSIEGRNFLPIDWRERRSDPIHFNFGSAMDRSFEVEFHPDDWTDTHIRCRLSESISQMPRTTGTVMVENSLGLQSNRKGVTFVPAEEIITLEPETRTATCNPVFPPFICFAGENNRIVLYDFQLKNSWVVDDSWLEVEEWGVNAGAYFEREPSVGSTNCRTIVRVWADALSRSRCKIFLSIRGPRGIRYQ